MLTRIAMKRTGLAGVLAFEGLAMAACDHQEPDPATVAVFGAVCIRRSNVMGGSARADGRSKDASP